MRIIVDRHAPDGLSRTVWRWYLYTQGNGLCAVLDGYAEEARPTKRHQFRAVEEEVAAAGFRFKVTRRREYVRLGGAHRGSCLALADVPPVPEEVRLEVREKVAGAMVFKDPT